MKVVKRYKQVVERYKLAVIITNKIIKSWWYNVQPGDCS